MVQKPKKNQIAGFFKLQYLTKNLRREVDFFDMTRVQERTKYQLAASSGCAQACLNMPIVTGNSESALTQE